MFVLAEEAQEKGSAKADDLAPWLYLPQEKEKKKQDKELSK
ncbi:MAG: hypothetical protein P9M03_08085 [Candidatus Theseobacter exili]|nr:hypothetical protein [Candidatus Theseobacter exili]